MSITLSCTIRRYGKFASWIVQGESRQVFAIFIRSGSIWDESSAIPTFGGIPPLTHISILLYLLSSVPETIAVHGYRYLQPNFGRPQHGRGGNVGRRFGVYLSATGSSPRTRPSSRSSAAKMLRLRRKIRENARSHVYEYAVEEDCGHGDLAEERPTTIPAKMIAEHTLPGLTDQEPLVLAVSDF